VTVHQTVNDLRVFLRQARPHRLRTMRVFAEEEVVIPDGPYAGRRFRCSRQPYTALWFDQVDSGCWPRCVATGPTQSGKTLACFVVPLLYHLFEIQETVICGLPDMDMAGDKWREDILAAIERSRYRDLLPRRGGGSRGGRVESIQFGNGATLKFMSGGGGDKSRAGFTSRVVVSGHIVDYGRIEIASDDLGVEQATLIALRQFRKMLREGWPVGSANGEQMIPQQAWIDAGYMTPVVYGFCRESGDKFRPAIGRGAAQQHRQWYNRPTRTGALVKHVGEGFHINHLRPERLHIVEVDADHWKTWVHQRLGAPMEVPGAMSLFRAAPQEHLALAKHLTAETKTEEFVAGKGVVVKWQRLRRQNHWFDALYNACAAGYLCGVRLVSEPAVHAAPKPEVRPAPLTMPDGRPFLITER
jgi:hypothetical protein